MFPKTYGVECMKKVCKSMYALETYREINLIF